LKLHANEKFEIGLLSTKMTPTNKQKGSAMISHGTDEILTERELCNWLGVSEPTLFRHRRDGTGPRFIRLSARRVGYRHSAVEAWLRQREQRKTPHSETIDRPDDVGQANSR
jgi:predicted DNA-binding transcriptional regulator AlpA